MSNREQVMRIIDAMPDEKVDGLLGFLKVFIDNIVPEPKAQDEMTTEEFNAMMQRGLDEAKAGKGTPLKETFAYLRGV